MAAIGPASGVGRDSASRTVCCATKKLPCYCTYHTELSSEDLSSIFSERWSSLGYFSSCIYGVARQAICTSRPNAPREANIAIRFVHSCSPTPSSDGHGFRPTSSYSHGLDSGKSGQTGLQVCPGHRCTLWSFLPNNVSNDQAGCPSRRYASRLVFAR